MTFSANAHGPGSAHRSEENSAINEAVDIQQTGIPVTETGSDRDWGASLATGWESRHVHYGVDESGPSGAYVNEIGVRIGDFSANIWNGFGLGNQLVEWDFTAGYNFEVGPFFITPGYNLRYVPGYADNDRGESGHEEHGLESDARHAGDAGHNHAHNTYGNELFIVVGTTAIPYVTPSTVFIWDLDNNPGGFMEFRLDGEVPVYKDIVSFQPYALLGLNLGYNTSEVYSLNNFQTGLQATCRLCAWASIYAGINYSVALEALDEIGQGNVAWVNVGLRLAY
ncbi:MAG: hypothetical protein RIQ71_819 [Verrucomicrobiota bacterium]|jgi:hypothetical protein